jgi:hypothetical protein
MSAIKYCFSLLVLFSLVSTVAADEKLKGVACRSVHLAYSASEGEAFYNEVIVRQSAPGTYFMVCGFNAGYFGIQEQANNKKLLIFSVWDPGAQNDPNQVEKEQRVKLLYNHEKVRIGRFGNEGTGGQSFFDYEWKNDTTYRFLVTAKVEDKHTAFTGWFYHPEDKQWMKLVTFARLHGGKLLGGYYSFVEDFRRNKVSTTLNRRAEFGPAWVKTKSGELLPLNSARFTADANPVLNIDAGPVENQRMFLSTGGEIENKTVKLREKIELNVAQPQPPELPDWTK